MRRLIFILILSLIPLGIYAGTTTRMVTVPYYPKLADSISMVANKECQLQATLAAKTFQNAQKKLRSESEQLAIWDAFMATDLKDSYEAGYLAKLRKLLIMSYSAANKYPDLTPQEYGSMIYEACAAEHPMTKVKV